MKQPSAPTLGLDRMKSLMNRLGNPQEKLKIIHLAGTNGKGSVAAMLNAVLIEAGYRVGLFTSPHLINFNERIQIQNTVIDQESFEKLKGQIQAISKEMVGDGEEAPTFFEYISAMAFLYFSQQKVDIVVLETGIGGRFDATNIIRNPLVSVISSIGRDHMSMLGEGIEEITREKAGIIKENATTVLYDSTKLVYNTIEAVCKAKNNLLFSCRDVEISKEVYKLTGTTFTAKHPFFIYEDMELHLLGHHQVSNAVTSLMTIESLRRQAYVISKQAVYKGLKNAKWPGRMEVIQKSPAIILDGAHNVQSAKAIKSALTAIGQGGKLYIMMGFLKDKDYLQIIDILIAVADKIIVAQVTADRALPAKMLYQALEEKAYPEDQLILEENIKHAYETGKKLLNEKDILCCLGSLYLVGEIKKLLE